MPDPYLIHFELRCGPAEKLPLAAGFLDAAVEHRLLWVVLAEGQIQALPFGMLWGQFADAAGALAAFGRAVEAASELLGFQVRPVRALASRFEDPRIGGLGGGRAPNPALAGQDRFSLCLMHQLFDPPGPARRPGRGRETA